VSRFQKGTTETYLDKLLSIPTPYESSSTSDTVKTKQQILLRLLLFIHQKEIKTLSEEEPSFITVSKEEFAEKSSESATR
jgi:hypothetical protein